ncbi:MAG: nucleotidyltransferase family protein [Chlamydiales bacterium]
MSRPVDSGNGWPTAEQTLLLKACLDSGAAAKAALHLWKEKIDFDKMEPASYKLLPLLCRNIKLADDPIFEKCKGIYRRTWVENQLLWKHILSTLIQLRNAGISQIVLLKGMAMILRYYRDFGARVIGDVDILIPRGEAPLAGRVLQRAGWRQAVSRFELDNEEHTNRWHALNFLHPAGLRIDLHWSLIQENSRLLDEAVLKHAEPLAIKGVSLYIPSPTELLLQTAVHGVKYSPVPLIRWIADATTLLRQAEKGIDWDRLIELAKLAHVCTPLYFALQYLNDHFEAPIPKKTLQKLKHHPSHRLEKLEYRFHALGYTDRAAWYRYCLTRGLLTRSSQIFHIHKYLQFTARLKSPWQIPFFALYWILKRIYRLLKRIKL